MGMQPSISSELVEDVMELTIIAEDAMADGSISRAERTAILSQIRLVQHRAGQVDAGIRHAVSYLRLNRLTPGVLRATRGAHDDAA